jgi:hypothetical protein
MKTSRAFVTASAALLLALTTTRNARALGPIDLEIAGKAGYGSHDLGAGFGGRAGVSFFGIYGGLNIVDYLGLSPGAGLPSTHTLTYGGEVGFGFKISRLTIRPLLGFGDASQSFAGFSASSFYLEPGGLLQLKFGVLIFGVDASCLILTSAQQQAVGAATGGSTASEAFTIHGQVGLAF